MKTLYFDCFAGASGNMILGGLIDLGIPESRLMAELRRLSIPEFELEYSRVNRSGIAAIHVSVKIPDEKKHRHLKDIVRIISESQVSEITKRRSIAIFQRLADAEAKVHGVEIEKVHFHEVGALDAIVDVVGSCIGFELLGIERFVCSKINLGSGFIDIDHGRYPVPPPAVVNLLVDVPVYSSGVDGELTTPTGAAIISTLSDSYGVLPSMTVEKSGYGAGSRTYERFPNALRLIMGDSVAEIATNADGTRTETLVQIEANLDDVSPQVIGYTIEKLFAVGILDCWTTSIQMKKSRPGVKLSVLCEHKSEAEVSSILFRETTTLGLRRILVDRVSIKREIRTVRTRFGEIAVKFGVLGDQVVNIMPEYEDVRRAALENEVPLTVVQQEAVERFLNSELAAGAK